MRTSCESAPDWNPHSESAQVFDIGGGKDALRGPDRRRSGPRPGQNYGAKIKRLLQIRVRSHFAADLQINPQMDSLASLRVQSELSVDRWGIVMRDDAG